MDTTAIAGEPRAPSRLPRRPRLLRVRPPRLALLLAAAALGAHGLVFGAGAPLGRWPLPGLGLAMAGLAWMTWAWWRFRVAGTPIRPTDPPRVLVDDGPFAYGRNPMYLGLALALLGAGVALGVPFLAAAAPVFALLLDRVHVRFEEAALRRTFGGWYSDYAARVRRWF